MSHDPIFIFLPEEALELFADNQINLAKQLADDGFDVAQTHLPDPSASGTNQSRSLTLAILASGVALSLLGASISRILDAIGRNTKFRGKEIRCTPALDGQGHAVRDKDGQIVMTWVEGDKLLEASQTIQDKLSHKGEFLGLKFEITSGE